MGRMDRIGWIVSAGLYQLDRIGIGLGYLGETGLYTLAGLLLAVCTVWDVGGMGVG